MTIRLAAFDLDGTLLTSDKKISPANRRALSDMEQSGVRVALASGRLGSSMALVAADIDVDVAMMTLNGAEVYTTSAAGAEAVYRAPLDARYADELIRYGRGKNFAVNYYLDGKLYCVENERTRRWLDLYYRETRTPRVHVEDLDRFQGRRPSKLIYVGEPRELDSLEEAFRLRWDLEIYICRTWDHYLEFLHRDANKGRGLDVLARAFGFSLADVVAFGDAENDIPMLSACGTGIAMKNAGENVKRAATRVSAWTNDEDGVAREWELLKTLL